MQRNFFCPMWRWNNGWKVEPHCFYMKCAWKIFPFDKTKSYNNVVSINPSLSWNISYFPVNCSANPLLHCFPLWHLRKLNLRLLSWPLRIFVLVQDMKNGFEIARHACAATPAFHLDAPSPTWFKVVTGVVLQYPIHAFLVFPLDDTVFRFWDHLGDTEAASTNSATRLIWKNGAVCFHIFNAGYLMQAGLNTKSPQSLQL